MITQKSYFPSLEDIKKAEQTISGTLSVTPLTENHILSTKYSSNIFLKREDLQIVRSYKIRGAYNMIKSLTSKETTRGLVCASAGNHAQGVAFSCFELKIHCKIFMPVTTPQQKINQVKMFGGEFIEIILEGNTFDQANSAAIAESEKEDLVFIPPFDHPKIIEGQATLGGEIIRAISDIDYIFVPIGGGGLAAGLGSFFKQVSPKTKIIGVEPFGAQSMGAAIDNGGPIKLHDIDKFVDGAAVQKVGDITYEICKNVLDDVISVSEGLICTTILNLYNLDAIVVEPAGALGIAALEVYKDEIKGKNVVCIISGSNNDITRIEDIKEKSLLFEGLEHYFIIRFAQKAGALKAFVNDILGPNDDITYFEYKKKNNREKCSAVVGIKLEDHKDLKPILNRMEERGIQYDYLNDNPNLFEFIIR